MTKHPNSSRTYWAIVPAAGQGHRYQTTAPKQYTVIGQSTVLEHSLRALLAESRIKGIVIALDEQDAHFQTLACAHDTRVITVKGGASRMQSVRNALQALKTRATDTDWVLVHDAARPCLTPSALTHLIETLKTHPVGGVLATPVHSTLKQADAHGYVVNTQPRTHMWLAHTPQMFQYARLNEALLHASEQGVEATDEAQAIEALGFCPKLVAHPDPNPKLTTPEDLAFIEYLLNT